MDSIYCYISILVSLLAFFCAILAYLKYFYSPKVQFSKVELSTNGLASQVGAGVEQLNSLQEATNEIPSTDTPVHLLDTRNKYSEIPPVNPTVEQSQILKVVPANEDLYSSQDFSTDYYLLDQPTGTPTNQLDYSGGATEIIKIPLQFNVPTDEQLRSQEILITDYNKIKYGSC